MKNFLKKKNLQSGFTLIELLVVIAIIAILSAIILVSLNSARAKAKDAKVQSELSDVRAQMELYYDSNSYSYGTAQQDCSLGGFGSGTDNASNLINGIKADIGSRLMDCNATGDAWAVDAQLASNDYWCVDSNGDSKNIGQTSIGTSTDCLSVGGNGNGNGNLPPPQQLVCPTLTCPAGQNQNGDVPPNCACH